MTSGLCLDGLSLALTQISFAVTDISKRNFKSNVSEIKNLVHRFGPEAEKHLLKCLLSYVDFGAEKGLNKDSPQISFLIQELQEIVTRPNFVSIICYIFDHPETSQKSVKPTNSFFNNLGKILKLTKVQEVVFGIALQNSENLEFRNLANNFVKQKLPDLLRSYIEADISSSQESIGLSDVAIEVLHLLLNYLNSCSKEDLNIKAEEEVAFLDSLRRDFPKERVPVVLAPLLYKEERDKEETSIRINLDCGTMLRAGGDVKLCDVMEELGYSCCASREECRDVLAKYGVANINPNCVAKVLGMMCRTLAGLEGSVALQSAIGHQKKSEEQLSNAVTWNFEILIDTLKELVPTLNWRQVIFELDHPGFIIKKSEAIRLIVLAYIHATNEIFPVDAIYKPWNYSQGQLSWIEHCLSDPRVFCFADYPRRLVATDILKSPPDESNKDVMTWRSLDLVEILLHLSESGHYEAVLKLFAFPVKNCPDVLLLALLQVNATWHTLRNDLVSMLMPLFLGNHPNSMSILHYAWNGQGQSPTIRQLVMQAMADLYSKADAKGDQVEQQTKLSRILDVAQDLKALSMLLNSTPFSFVIDLGALASRREYLKLDKWLNDKTREHPDQFPTALVSYLKKRCPQLIGIAPDKDLPRAVQLPKEAIEAMLSCLQQQMNSMTPDVAATAKSMLASHGPLMKPRPLTMPPKRPGFDGGMGTPPIGGLQADPFSSYGSSGQGSSPLSAFGSHPLAGTPLGASQSFGGLGGLTATIQPPKQSQTSGGLLSSSNGIQSSSAFSSGLVSSGISSQNNFMQQFQQNAVAQSAAGMLSGSPIDSLQQSLGSSVGSIGQHKRASAGTSLSGFSNFQQQQQQQQQASISQSRQQAERLRQVAIGDLSAVFPGMDQNFSKEIEDESNTYFQRIYNQPPGTSMSIDEVLEMLKRFKDSPVKKERDVFLCMLRNLFEEYRFFPQYPEKELHTTACLFGGIIEQGLVTYMALGVALRYVLEALRKPPGGKMYMFGTTALDRFKTRLKDYPHYCQHLASIPHFKDFPPHLVDYIVFGQRNQEPPSATRTNQNDSPLFGGRPSSAAGRLSGFSSSSSPPPQQNPLLTSSFSSGALASVSSAMAASFASTTSATLTKVTATLASTAISDTTATSTTSATAARKEPSIANTTNIDTLLGATEPAEIKQPPDTVQDKIHFIFNNISSSNIPQKAEELKQLVQSEFFSWLAQYFVMKRVSIEPNFHQMYTDFLKALEMGELSKQVLQETFRNIKVLLRSDKGPANFSDRSLLKNLGKWLGLLTLGSDKPILYEDLELKSLVIEAFFKGQQELLYVVPFVAKVLESCAKSKVFKPPNPWLMGVMGVLAELHQMQDLKLNLKFEVEVLCNTLTLDLKDVNPSELLKDREILNKIDHQLTVPEKEKLSPDSQQLQNAGPPPPLFSYHEINVSGIAGLAPFIQINQNIPLFQQYPHLKQCIRPAIERAVQELLAPVVERCVKICLTTVEMVVKKDFSLDPEESRTRLAAHHMARNITAGMTMITCKDPLQQSLNNNIKSNLMATLRSANSQQKEQLEHYASIVAADNLELACSFIQKSAVEKCLAEIDKRLLSEYEVRKLARGESRRYCDPYMLTYQAERMPEQIRMKVGGVTSSQMSVYEEFAKSIPGFLPPEVPGAPPEPFPKPLQEPITGLFGNTTQDMNMPDDVVHILGKCAAEIEQHIHHMEQAMHQMLVPPPNPHLAQLHNLLDMVVNARVTRDNLSALQLIRKAVEGILETMLPTETEMALRYKDCHLIVLRGFQDPRGYGPLWTARQVLRVLTELPAEVKFNIEGIDILIRANLINVSREFDPLLVQWMEGGQNYRAVNFAMQLCSLYLIEEKKRSPITESELANTLDALFRIQQTRQNPEGLANLLDNVHPQQMPQGQQGFMGHYQSDQLDKGAVQGIQSPISHGLIGHEFEDPPGLHEKVEYLLKEWVRLYHHASAGRYSEKAFQAFVPQLHQYGILKTDDLITRFFRICTEICVNITYKTLSEYAQNMSQARTKCFTNTDAYCRLIALLVKHSGDSTNNVTKINLLNRVLGIIGNVLLQDHEVKKTEFHQLAYQRMFVILLLELNAPEPVLEAINFQILSCFGTVLHDLRPSRAPGFAYAWLELVAHRTLMSKLLLNSPQQKGWVLYHQLLIDLFKFLAPFLRNVELAKQTHLLYKGTLRVLLVLLHDFPEFLCDYHFSFCDVIPPNCIQMRNLILSAFPRNMRLPDPFTPNLKVDLLTDIARAPRILTNFSAAIQPPAFKKDLDSYLKTRAPVTFLSEFRSHLQISNEPGTRYNVPLMNALVLYVGTQAIAYIQSKSGTPSISTITHSSHMDIFQNLAVDLDTEGRYLFLNAIANQLRYPNSHTHYFSCTLLYLFAEANSEAIQEQITRVLLERLIVNRPHPWGLLITFIELIKNHNYKFWNHDFVHCAPEIEKLFESVARSCMQQKQPNRNGSETQET